MIESTTLHELDRIIKNINDKSMTVDELNKLTANPKLLLDILSSINKTNIKQLSTNSSHKDKAKITNQFTKEQVFEIISSKNRDEILANYTKEQLVEMHIAVCGTKPLSSFKKEKIFQEIIGWYSYAERNKALSEM